MHMNATDNSTGDEGTDEYLIALAVGIPCGFVIVVLVCVTAILCCLILHSSSEEQVEAVYMRRRFQGLSLEDQKRMKRKKRKLFQKRKSSQPVSRSSSQMSTRVPRNPFGLQEWQLRLSSADLGEPETDETETGGDDDFMYRKRAVGAINPLLIGETGHHPGYDAPPGGVPLPDDQSEGSSDSFNPYDD